MIFLLRSRHDVGGRRKKKRPTQLCTTQLYKNIQTSKFHTDYFITSFCIIASLRSHLATIASVEFSWFGTKTYPIPTHLVASHHETLQSPTNLRTCRIGWGEPKAKRKHCTRTPCVSGRESHPLFSNTHTHTHTSSNASDHESAGATSHWRHCVSAFFIAVDVNVCVCVSGRVTLAGEKFSISKWRPTCFRNFSVWIVGKRFECDASKASFVL